MKNYFYKVKYGAATNGDRSHWMFGVFENKKKVIESHDGQAFEILTVKQMFQKYDEHQIRSIARNCMVYQPNIFDQLPVEVRELMR